jgi:hypothetical protein
VSHWYLASLGIFDARPEVWGPSVSQGREPLQGLLGSHASKDGQVTSPCMWPQVFIPSQVPEEVNVGQAEKNMIFQKSFFERFTHWAAH